MRKPVTRQIIANHLEDGLIVINFQSSFAILYLRLVLIVSPFKAGKGIPLELNPAVGRELAEEALDLTPADKG